MNGSSSLRSSALSFRSSEADRTGARAYIFRPDTRAGLKEVMEYFRMRDIHKDPWKWPERPQVNVVGLKNMMRRMRTDLETYMEWSGHSTTKHTFLVRMLLFHANKQLDEALEELQRFLVSCPPKHYHTHLGGSIISAYTCLHKPGALDNWQETSRLLEFYCIQCRDAITTKRVITHFEEHAQVTKRESLMTMTDIENRPIPEGREFRPETPQAKTKWWKKKK